MVDFVLKDNGQEMAYAAFVGGSGDESGYAIAVDEAGNAYVTGVTDSPDLPATADSFAPDISGEHDAFVVKLDATGAGLAYATFLGGSEDDWGRGIAVDSSGNAYVTGYTSSTQASFPVTVGPDLTHNGHSDAFVAKTNYYIKNDFNSDGQGDILWRHYGTGANAVWYLDGMMVIGSEYLSTVTDTGWKIDGLGDFNGDGKVDILWRHYGTGTNAVWYMDGITATGSEYISTVTDTGWDIENH